MADVAKKESNSLMWVWILLAIGGLGALGYFVVYPWFTKDKDKTKDTKPDIKPTSGGNDKPTGGGGNNGNGNGGGNTGPTKLTTSDVNWNGSLKSLASSFSKEGLITQTILRFKGFKGKNNKVLTLDGKAGTNTQFAIAAFWKGEKVDYDDQSLEMLISASKADVPSVLQNQKANIEAGTGNKYTV